MAKTIQQKVEFEGVTPQELFDIYLDAKKHSAVIGSPVKIKAEVGSEFRAFGDDGVKGRILALVPGRMIVQLWRGQPWTGEDLDSTVVFIFEKTAKGARIDFTQIHIPDDAYELVNEQAWKQLYWQPLRQYLAKNA